MNGLYMHCFRKILQNIIKPGRNMQFTQITSISNIPTSAASRIHQDPFSKSLFGSFQRRAINQRQIYNDDSQYSHIMKNLNEVVTNQSYIHNFEDQEGLFGSQKIGETSLVKSQSGKDKQNQSSSSTFDNQNYKKYDKTKSIIFSSSLSNVRFISNSIQKEGNRLKIFYFDQPIFKYVHFDQKTTILQVVEKALKKFVDQNKFDQNHRASQLPQMYQIRLPQNQTSFKSDRSVEPIDFDRMVSDNLFQTLVLIQKQKKNETPSSFRKSQLDRTLMVPPSYRMSRASFESLNSMQNKSVKLTLVNEAFFEIAEMQLKESQTIQKLYKYIQENDLHQLRNFYITQDNNSDFSLPLDFQVKNLESCTLFVKIKRYADEASDQRQLVSRPMRLNTMIPRQVNYLPPIGINQASKYEEYDVVKINKLGIAQDRVLGIDQMKLYNYEKNIRKQKKQITIFSKFIGLNYITGTKKPFRLIKDIQQIKKFNGGLIICFPEKQITYIIKQEPKREQILRKLNFLMTLSSSNEKSFKSQTQINY